MSWENLESPDDDTVEVITPFTPPEHPVKRIISACMTGMEGETAIRIEDDVNKALRKLMSQAFLSGFSAGYQEQTIEHTAQGIYNVTADAIQVAISDDPITPILKFYQGDPTELIRLLSLLLSKVRIEGFINGWRIYIKDTGGNEPDTKQWMLAQDFTPQGISLKFPTAPKPPKSSIDPRRS